MLSIAGVLIYFLLFVFLLIKINKKNSVYLKAIEITTAFAFKVFMGCLYGYIFLNYYDGDDTWAYNNQSVIEHQKLFQDPLQFFADLLPYSAFSGANSFWQGVIFYAMDLEYWLILKLLAVFNIFSRGNYFINVVFFNLLTFWGSLKLFRLLVSQFPEKRLTILFFIFFFPPAVFWLSGIRADGLLFLFISLALVHFKNWLDFRKAGAFFYFLLAITGILIFRSVLVILLLPSLVSWYITQKFQTKPLLTFLIVHFVSILLFFGSTLISSEKNLPAVVANRQHEFLKLQANTTYQLDTLQPNLKSFLVTLPQSLTNTFFRPYPWEAKGVFQWSTAWEVVFFWLVVLLFFLKHHDRWKIYLRQPMVLSFVFFGAFLYIFIGLTVPFPGAIVRYKIIGELLLLLALAICIRDNKTNIKEFNMMIF